MNNKHEKERHREAREALLDHERVDNFLLLRGRVCAEAGAARLVCMLVCSRLRRRKIRAGRSGRGDTFDKGFALIRHLLRLIELLAVIELSAKTRIPVSSNEINRPAIVRLALRRFHSSK